jgi:hypothetical protein
VVGTLADKMGPCFSFRGKACTSNFLSSATVGGGAGSTSSTATEVREPVAAPIPELRRSSRSGGKGDGGGEDLLRTATRWRESRRIRRRRRRPCLAAGCALGAGSGPHLRSAPDSGGRWTRGRADLQHGGLLVAADGEEEAGSGGVGPAVPPALPRLLRLPPASYMRRHGLSRPAGGRASVGPGRRAALLDRMRDAQAAGLSRSRARHTGQRRAERPRQPASELGQANASAGWAAVRARPLGLATQRGPLSGQAS